MCADLKGKSVEAGRGGCYTRVCAVRGLHISEGVSGGCFAVSWGEYSVAAQVCELIDGIGPVGGAWAANLPDIKFKEEQK